MGRSATFYCYTCKVRHYLGYGSYGTWLDSCKTLEEYDQQPEDLRQLRKNQNFRRALKRHEPHEWSTYSGDYTHTHPGVLCSDLGAFGACLVLIEDYDDWTSEPFWED